MCAITSSSAMCPTGEKSAIPIVSSPAAKQHWRQTGTGRPRAARVEARFAYRSAAISGGTASSGAKVPATWASGSVISPPSVAPRARRQSRCQSARTASRRA